MCRTLGKQTALRSIKALVLSASARIVLYMVSAVHGFDVMALACEVCNCKYGTT